MGCGPCTALALDQTQPCSAARHPYLEAALREGRIYVLKNRHIYRPSIDVARCVRPWNSLLSRVGGPLRIETVRSDNGVGNEGNSWLLYSHLTDTARRVLQT